MKLVILAAAVVIAFIAGMSAQDKPTFAGTWRSVDSFTRWTITVEGSTMTITRTVAGNSESTVYMLDGTPSKETRDGPNGRIDSVSTSTWEGDVLVTTIVTGATTRIEKRSIQADGTMKVENTFILQGKSQAAPPQVLKKIG